MKERIFIIIIILFSSLLVNGQELYSFNEQNIVFENTLIPVMAAHLETEEDQVKQALKDYLKKEMDIRIRDKKTYFLSDENKLFPISDKSGQLIVFTERDLNGTIIYVAARFTPDLYISAENFSEETLNMQRFLNRFSYDYMYKEIKNAYKSFKTNLKQNSKRLKRSARKIDKYQEKIFDISNDSNETYNLDNTSYVPENDEIRDLKAAIRTEEVIIRDLSENIQRLEVLVNEYQYKFEVTRNRKRIYDK